MKGQGFFSSSHAILFLASGCLLLFFISLPSRVMATDNYVRFRIKGEECLGGNYLPGQDVEGRYKAQGHLTLYEGLHNAIQLVRLQCPQSLQSHILYDELQNGVEGYEHHECGVTANIKYDVYDEPPGRRFKNAR